MEGELYRQEGPVGLIEGHSAHHSAHGKESRARTDGEPWKAPPNTLNVRSDRARSLTGEERAVNAKTLFAAMVLGNSSTVEHRTLTPRI
jgi:hypothetical protein